MDYEELQAMVKLINEQEVAMEDVLSDRVYRYSLETDAVAFAE